MVDTKGKMIALVHPRHHFIVNLCSRQVQGQQEALFRFFLINSSLTSTNFVASVTIYHTSLFLLPSKKRTCWH